MNWQPEGWQPQDWQPSPPAAPNPAPFLGEMFRVDPDRHCAPRESVCFRVGEIKTKCWDWTLAFARLWQPQRSFANGERMRPQRWDATLERLVAYGAQTGFEYGSNGGVSGYALNRRGEIVPPVFGIELGATFKEGSITWSTSELSLDSLVERIADAAWTASDGFDIVPLATVDEAARQESPVQIEALEGATGGVVICRLTTTAGNKYDAIFDVTIDP